MGMSVEAEADRAALLAELDEAAASLEEADATTVIGWAAARYRERLSLASSFQDAVLIDLATQVDPGVEVIFLDTGFHFPETLAFVEELRCRYELNLRVVRPAVGADQWRCGTDRCCEVRKVEPLNRALSGKAAWMTGLRRADSPLRASTPVLELDRVRGIPKLNPLAAWTDEQVEAYISEHALPVHPLTRRGYLSIGCAPTTTPVRPGEHPRSGRWRGADKTECGLHLPAAQGG
jgi:phosphoadenosine phosphosulfate reductase